MGDDTAHTLGYHAAKIENIETQVQAQGAKLGRMDSKLDQLLARENQRIGGFRALAAAGTFGGGVATLALKFLGFLKGGN